MAVKKDMMRGWRPMVQRTPLAPKRFMVAFEWKDLAGTVQTATAWARRNDDRMVEAAWEVELTGLMIRTAAERMKSLPNLGVDTRAYVERFLTPLPPDDESVFITANAASLIVGITKTKKLDLREPGPSAYAMFRLKTKTGEVTIDKLGEHDELITDGIVEPMAPAGSLTGWLRNCPNVVLEGVPGTGKTHAIRFIKQHGGLRRTTNGETIQLTLFGSAPTKALTNGVTRFMTMHPSTSYEDFVEGLRPAGAWTNSTAAQTVTDGESAGPLLGPWFHEETTSTTTAFASRNGFFVEACVAAVADPNTAVIVVLDELNRCNIPKVLGDLMTVIEESKRAQWNGMTWVLNGETQAVTLPYSGRKLFVPDNLFIVGTMNTTDRSVAPMDAALRRRFAFHRIWPDGFSATKSAPTLTDVAGELREPIIKPHTELWLALNRILFERYGADAMLGHSYLYDLRTALKNAPTTALETATYHWNHRILPQLMDVIASNGLTRLLVNDPKAFFAKEPKAAATTERDNAAVLVFGDKIRISFSGTGSQRMAHLEFVTDQRDAKEPKAGVTPEAVGPNDAQSSS
jgi:hypothetical protein